MAVKIRLKRMGSKKRPFYRLVAADSRRARDGRFIELLGYYDPLKEPADIKLDDDKVFKWLDRGAEPSENAAGLLRKVGLLERWRLLKEGVKITELDAVIEERRKKQPSSKPKEVKEKEKADKKALEEAEKKAEEEAEKKAAEEAKETAPGEASSNEGVSGEDSSAEEVKPQEDEEKHAEAEPPAGETTKEKEDGKKEESESKPEDKTGEEDGDSHSEEDTAEKKE